MITQRRQANNTQVSPSTSLSVCMCQYGVHMYVCVCVREYSRGARTSERTTENMTTSAKKENVVIKLETSANFIGLQGLGWGDERRGSEC